MSDIAKLLIANRGEIALRIMRSARALGCRTVAVYSEADAGAPHVLGADEAVAIGPAPAAQSYLSIKRILAAAAETGADAVHPGYGFLAENAAFATACRDAGLVFVGPDPEAIRVMGSKSLAKERASEVGVPVIAGYDGADQGDEGLLEAAAGIGAPLMVKAVAGGGGRGLRRVDRLEDLPAALERARAEAMSAFGDDALILETVIEGARHVEVQVLADRHGHTIHLGERDCSVQRRHQKVIEEAPSPAVSPALRAAMGEAAVAVARAVDYVGAGTVEFLLDRAGAYYFMEMNTRLQVEHPVTEAVTGLDMVALQLRIAAGEPLPIGQEDVEIKGHAIEARLYAEDAYGGFLPQSGRVLAWRPASGVGIRVDHAVAEGLEVGPFYDPLLAKIVAHGESREVARRRLSQAIDETLLLGLVTNKSFLGRVVGHETFVAGEAGTDFVDAVLAPELAGHPAPDARFRALAAVLLVRVGVVGDVDGWSTTGALAWPLRLCWPDGDAFVSVGCRDDTFLVSLDGEEITLALLEVRDGRVRFRRDGTEHDAAYSAADGVLWLDWRGRVERFHERPLQESDAGEGDGDDRLLAPMDGRIVEVMAAEGDSIARGQCVLVLEAMKIQHEVRAGRAGILARLAVAEGHQVAARQVLAQLAPESKAAE